MDKQSHGVSWELSVDTVYAVRLEAYRKSK